jgi:predicted DCC family thiol-disulfide oxidoreductase YuxK
VLALSNQTPGLIEQYGLTRAEVDREVWAIDRAGRKWGGAAAINRVLEELGGKWALLAKAYRLAPLRWLEDRVYRWVAAHRAWISRWWGAEPEWKE